MNGFCKLCGQESELKKSHFIPSFIGRWVKKTSITGFIRSKADISKRQQDITKEYWLCGTCEQTFSKWEREFAVNIFYPIMDAGNDVANYGDWMSKFCASLTWRTLTYLRSLDQNTIWLESYSVQLDAAERHLAGFLLGNIDNPGEYEQHFIPLGIVSGHTMPDVAKNINRYFSRSMGMDIILIDGELFVYTKIPGFLILGMISVKRKLQMRPSRISIKKGRVSPRKYVLPGSLFKYMNQKSMEVSSLIKSIPEGQQEKIKLFLENNPEKIRSSKMFDAFVADYDLFGKDVFK